MQDEKVHNQYMQRCLQLAALGRGTVSPNPVVGAVLVHDGKIIGEGWHKKYGGPHAEVNCINSVADANRHLVPEATMYVSLEPCCHYGKTPPCTGLIIENNIKTVVIGCRDSFEAVSGKGIEILRQAGVTVIEQVLREECEQINAPFFTFHRYKMPYVILKWAQTADGYIAPGQQLNSTERWLISNAIVNRLVHRWRSEADGIMIGAHTLQLDDPLLNVRLWPGKNPVKLILAGNNKLNSNLKIFADTITPVICFGNTGVPEQENVQIVNITQIDEILNYLYRQQIQTVLVEGGAHVLEQFISGGFYNEIRVITNNNLLPGNGLKAPVFPGLKLINSTCYADNRVNIYSK